MGWVRLSHMHNKWYNIDFNGFQTVKKWFYYRNVWIIGSYRILIQILQYPLLGERVLKIFPWRLFPECIQRNPFASINFENFLLSPPDKEFEWRGRLFFLFFDVTNAVFPTILGIFPREHKKKTPYIKARIT